MRLCRHTRRRRLRVWRHGDGGHVPNCRGVRLVLGRGVFAGAQIMRDDFKRGGVRFDWRVAVAVAIDWTLGRERWGVTRSGHGVSRRVAVAVDRRTGVVAKRKRIGALADGAEGVATRTRLTSDCRGAPRGTSPVRHAGRT